MEGDNLNWSIEYFESQPNECVKILKENPSKVSIANRQTLNDLKDGDLVRYRGMVQDMMNPEYYYPNYCIFNTDTKVTSTKSGKYRDVTRFQDNEVLNEDSSIPEERQVLFCIPLPGLTPWVEALSNSYQPRTKCLPVNGTKRPLEDEPSSDSVRGDKSTKLIAESKPQMCSEAGGQFIHHMDKYYPVSNQSPGLPCLVKLYHEYEDEMILLNDCVEIIGFLSLDPALEATWENSDAEDRALHPPPSLVPRIHAVCYSKILHCNPLLDQHFLNDVYVGEAEQAYSDLRLVLTQVLCGDQLAADYFICHLLSRVYVRSELHTLGHFSLNLYNVPTLSDYGRRLFEIIQLLVTHAAYLPLSMKILNEEAFVPKKDYETNRLLSGRLQLPSGTHLLLDETQMEEGVLRQAGMRNMQALQTVVRDQKLTYDFEYYPVEYNTNVAVLVISDGKTILDSGVQLKLNPDPAVSATIEETIEAAKFFLNGELLARIRKYLTVMRLLEFDFDETLSNKVAEDYADLRRRDRVTPEDLHRLLVLARLVAISQGRGHSTSADWDTALSMDTERRSRVS